MSSILTTFRWNTPGQVIAASVILPTLGIVAVSLRFWARFVQKTGIGLDDWSILLALVPVVGLGIDLLYGVSKHALAYPTPPNIDPNPESQLYQLSAFQELQEKVLWTFLTLLIPAYGLIKLSVIFFYRRLFVKGVFTRFDIVSKASIVLVLIWTFTFFFIDIFGCGTSVSTHWAPLIDYLRCINGIKWNFAFYVTDFVTDFLIICLPLPIIARLQMPLSQKLAVVSILLLGAMSIAASITRIVFSWGTVKAGFTRKEDVDETDTILLYWSMLEAGLSLIATCLPILRPIFTQRFLKSIIATIRSTIPLHSVGPYDSNSSRQYGTPYTEIRASQSRTSSQATRALDKNFMTRDESYGRNHIIAVPLADLTRAHVESKIGFPDYSV